MYPDLSYFYYLFTTAVCITLALHIMNYYKRKRSEIIQLAKQRYEEALRSGDKRAALHAGRAYYKELRLGMLTYWDEQAIANDIATML